MEDALIQMLLPVTENEQMYLDQILGKGTVREPFIGDISMSGNALRECKIIECFLHGRFSPCGNHRHDHVEMVYVLQGSVTHIMNGKDRVVLEAGDLMFMNTHVYHSIETCGLNDLMLVFVTQPQFFTDIISHLPASDRMAVFLNNNLRDSADGSNYLIYRDLDEICRVTARSIFGEAHEGSMEGQICAQLLMQVLLLHMTKITASSSPGGHSTEDIISSKVHQYIETNYKDASLEELAANIPCSTNYLSKLIRRVTGKSYRDILTETRMKKAAELLKSSSLSVSDVADAVGYQNSSFFYSLFREKYGCTPKEYRGKR